jgi:hypothetical protein
VRYRVSIPDLWPAMKTDVVDAAITGLVAYPGEGIAKSIHSIMRSDHRKTIASARRVEARVWTHHLVGQIDTQRVMDWFERLTGTGYGDSTR